MFELLLLCGTQVVGEHDRLRSVLHQPAIGRVAHNGQRPCPSIDRTEGLDAAIRSQRRILDNVFGVGRTAGKPLCKAIGFGHVRQKDFIERFAFILVWHNWDRRLLLARQPI
jgi:hypothetical protein